MQFNYWDTGHQGLLSGEALYLDLKRMELAYHDNNKREFELTRHVSLAQLDLVALLALKMTGTCNLTVPEWLFDLMPGPLHAPDQDGQPLDPMRGRPLHKPELHADAAAEQRPDLAALVNSTYARDTTTDDARFIDYYGGTDIVVTSSGDNDSGMFEPNLNDQPLPAVRGRRRDQHLDAFAAGPAAHVRLHDDLGRDPAPALHGPFRRQRARR